MELPEQDRQAFIEAARRRTQPQQGGAAFGVYPSSGKRPEKLNVSRDVNMPAQVARGWVAGTLGLPGDIESLGRMALNAAFGRGGVDVSETPFLPTSEFYQEYLPGRDERPAAQFASGLGALAGGAGSTKVAGAAVKGAKATGKALGPKAAEMAESYLQRSGLAPELIAYQGSPHKFAPEPDAPFGKFRSEKIGTGEGAQAYGQGHYLAEAPEVAKGYRDRLSGSNYVNAATGELAESGKAWTDATKAVQDTGINKVQHPDRAGSIASQIQDWVDSGKTARSFLLRHTVPKELEPAYEAAIDSFDLYRKNKGYLYTVDVPDEMIGKMLDWDRPLSQQPEALKPLLKEIESVGEVAAEKIRALAQQPGVADWAKRDLLSDAAQVAKSKSPAHVAGVLKRMQLEYGISPDSGAFQEVAPDFLSFVRGMQAVPNMDTGGGAVSFLQARYGDKGASEMLRQAGIPGIKYLDEGSRGPSGSGRWNIKFPDGTEQIFNFKPSDDVLKQMNATAEPAGTRNFVIFPGEEESVKIIDRKAEGGLVQDTDAIVAQLKGMDKDKALTQALRMANAKQEAHMAAGGLAKLLKGAKKAEDAGKVAKPAEKAAEAAKPAVKGPQAEALETARKNAVKMLKLPPQNTPQERAKAMGYVPDVSGNLYRGSHQAPVSSRGDVAAPAHALDQVYPDDVYSSKAARYYGHGSDPSEDADVVRRLQRVKSHPDEPLVVFRAVPKDAPDHINHGDWVTLSKKYAEEHGEGRFGDDYKVIRDRVPAKTLFTDGNSIYEFGYDKTQRFAEGPASLPVMRSPIPGRRERSSFAAFDPARSSENDILGAADPALLAGTAVASGIGLGALGQMSKPKPEQEEKKKAAGGLAKRM